MNRWLKRAALSLGCSLLLPGCDGDQAPLGLCDRQACPADCRALSAEGTCDVYDSDCQERAFRAVGCVRAEEGVLPPIRVLSREEQRLEDERMARPPDLDAVSEEDAGSEDGGSAWRAPPLNVRPRALGLFGLWQERKSGERSAKLSGYYRGSRLGVTLVDDGEPPDSCRSQRVLAHEFVHAYQDQQIGLFGGAAGFGANSDAALMFKCLVEGEARLYELLAWALLSDSPLDAAFMRETFTGDLERARTIIATGGSPDDDLQLICYGLGASYLFGTWLEGGNAAVRSHFDAPPVSSVRWMRGIAERSDRRWDTAGRGLSCAMTPGPDGYALVSTDSMGALRMFALLSTALGPDNEAVIAQSWDRALEWQRDSFDVFLGPDYAIAVSWRIRLADEALAAELARELADARPDLLVRHAGAEIVLRAAESTRVVEEWTDCDSCASGF